MVHLYKKELYYYLNNATGYIVVILFAVFANFMFMKDIFLSGSGSMRPFFGLVPWLLMVFIPAVSMRIIAEEKRINTLEVLLTLPVSETQLVIAKFAALMTVVLIGLSLTFGIPLTLAIAAGVYLPEIIVGYVGLILLSAAYTGISMFFSSLTRNQVIALLASVIVLFLLNVLATDFVATAAPKVVQDNLMYFSPLYHLQNFMNGLLDIRSITYFVSLTVVSLFVTIADMEKRG